MADTKFINLTDETIRIQNLLGEIITLEPLDVKQQLPGVSNETIEVGTLGNVPFEVRYKRGTIFLPPPQPDTIYLTSGMVSEVAERSDVFTVSKVKAIKQGGVVIYRRIARYTVLANEKRKKKGD